MRRHLEDMFQAIVSAVAGLFLLWSGIRLNAGGLPAGGQPLRSLADLQDAAGLAASAAGLLVLGWWSLGLAAALMSAILARLGRVRAAGVFGRFSPGFLRRLAAASLGVQLMAVPVPAALASMRAGDAATTPASASVLSAAQLSGHSRTEGREPGGARGVTAGHGEPGRTVDPGWQLESADRPDASAAVDPAWKPAPDPVPPSLLVPPGLRADTPSAERVTVMAGDTLWDLAAAQLGPLATAAEIAELWPRWYELNRLVVGPDPDVLLPGQILLAPPLPSE
ncbi:LysM peptidoglycan-binding domain-containing protein [Arthrobacter sp. Sa2CUA1]|uniref:LysM peptidoglycan-binding domain-containing protein n=1 Tax=Arthrobacter gallicola TaxID=2762225 RepID=A0ABR8US43_9MICC|nr:LysM domain-containing protein [Arthrobacter gallicola]MBD7995377.1 LysM peptidoglycan-binding domain-containing protein [Arthrobacter gallicola]